MPVLYPPEVCRSDHHTFEVPTERKLFHLRFESPPFPASFLSHPVKISINTEQSELRCLSGTCLNLLVRPAPISNQKSSITVAPCKCPLQHLEACGARC